MPTNAVFSDDFRPNNTFKWGSYTPLHLLTYLFNYIHRDKNKESKSNHKIRAFLRENFIQNVKWNLHFQPAKDCGFPSANVGRCPGGVVPSNRAIMQEKINQQCSIEISENFSTNSHIYRSFMHRIQCIKRLLLRLLSAALSSYRNEGVMGGHGVRFPLAEISTSCHIVTEMFKRFSATVLSLIPVNSE